MKRPCPTKGSGAVITRFAYSLMRLNCQQLRGHCQFVLLMCINVD